MLGVCMYVDRYVLTSIFIHAGTHEYVIMYVCMHVGR